MADSALPRLAAAPALASQGPAAPLWRSASRWALLSAACLTLVLLAARTASASPISFALTGHITTVIDKTQLLDSALIEGGQVDAAYTVRYDDDGGTTVLFGDGQTGRRVPADGGVIVGNYRAGSGTGGNVTFSEPCVANIDCNHLAAYILVLPLLTVDGVEQEFRMDLGGLEGSLFEPFRSGSASVNSRRAGLAGRSGRATGRRGSKAS